MIPHADHPTRTHFGEGFLRLFYERCGVGQAIAWRFEENYSEVHVYQILLVWYPLVYRYQRVELALSGLDELAILHAAPTALLDGDDLVLVTEETLEPAIEVLIKQ
jgi:hypothetical protein